MPVPFRPSFSWWFRPDPPGKKSFRIAAAPIDAFAPTMGALGPGSRWPIRLKLPWANRSTIFAEQSNYLGFPST
jgi:hypothetical protein